MDNETQSALDKFGIGLITLWDRITPGPSPSAKDRKIWHGVNERIKDNYQDKYPEYFKPESLHQRLRGAVDYALNLGPNLAHETQYKLTHIFQGHEKAERSFSINNSPDPK